MIRGFQLSRPRVIAAAVQTSGLLDAAAAAADEASVRVCSHERQLDDCLARNWAPVVVAELGIGTPASLLSRLMRGTGDSPVIAVLPPGPLPISQILALAGSGTRFELVHDASELPAAVRLAMSLPIMDSEIGEIARALSWGLDRLSLEYVVGLLILGQRRTSIGDALARLDRTSAIRTVLRERSLPKPARLMGWGSALHLVWHMERYGRDFTMMSRLLGFESTSHCSDTFKFHTGHAPMNVVRGHGFDGMLDEFVRRLGAPADGFAVTTQGSLSIPA